MTTWTNIPPLGDIRAYLTAIDTFPLLTVEEELAIGASPNQEGQLKLILSHLRLAASMARAFIGYAIPFDELIQEANMGLIKAAQKFDPAKGRFANIAMTYIRAHILEHTVRNSFIMNVATTKSQRKLFFNLNRMSNEILSKSGRSRLNSEDRESIAKKLDVLPEEVYEMGIRLHPLEIQVDQSATDDEDGLNSWVFADESYEPANVLDQAQREWLASDGVREAFNVLTDREQFIIEHRYMRDEPLTLRELAPVFGVSQQRVSQIERIALKKLRDALSEYAEYA